MKKCFALFLALILMLSLAACGSTPTGNDVPPSTEVPEEDIHNAEPTEPIVADTPAEETQEETSLDVDKNLFSVELTVPANFFSEDTTQESLDEAAAEKGFKSATLNPDGSVTYVMTKEQHKTLMEETKTTIDDALAEMVGSEEYPSFVGIEANDDYTTFDVTLSTETVSFTDSIAVLGFYMFGGFYNAFNGTPVDNITVNFISQATGEIIHTANSADMNS